MSVLRTRFFVVLACLLTACSQAAAPTLVPTIALPTARPAPTSAPSSTPPPSPTPAPPTPTATPTLSPEMIATLVAGLLGCDASVLYGYDVVVGALRELYAALEQQDFSQEAMLAALPPMQELEVQAEGLAVPCERALLLRQMLADHIGAEVEDLGDFTTGAAQVSPAFELWLDPNIERALEALRQDVQMSQLATANAPPFACDCSGDFYDCAYFRSRSEAQQCFDYCLTRTGDVHKLDENGDGIVCEFLP